MRSKKPAPKRAPNWVTETPPTKKPTPGLLSLIDDNEGAGVQDIDLTRAEYIELKAHLARLRGYVAPEEPAA